MRWLMVLVATLSLAGQEPADMPGHGALKDATACQTCHKEDGQGRWAMHRGRPCTPYCLTCHAKADMAQHHSVDVPLRKALPAPLPLTKEQRMACFTCHDLSRAREDGIPWKAESLFDRLFRKQRRYKTFFLVQRNERGQLCRICH
jgi:hypothetical protein